MATIEVEIEERHVEAVRDSTSYPSSDESAGHVFIIEPLAGYLVDPEMNLHVIFTVEKVTGSGATAKYEPIGGADKIVIMNYAHMGMWKTIEMEVNQKPIIPVNTLVNYASLIRAYQEYDSDGRNANLAMAGWDPDIPGLFETYTVSATDNPAFTRRHVLIQDSKDVEFYGPVMLGPLRQPKPFVDDAEIILTFTRQPATFFLLGDLGTATNVSFRVTIKKAVLYITRLKMRQGTKLGKEIGISYTSYETRHFMIPSGGQVISEDILRGPCPNRVIVGIVSQKAFFGDLKKNPNYLQHHLLASVFIKKDQMRSIPAEIYTTELGTSSAGTKYLMNDSRLYVETMKVLNDSRWLSHSSIGISRREFHFGNFLMGFDMRSFPGGSAPAGDVVLRFEATFHENFTEQILLIVALEYDRTLIIPTGPGRGEVVVI